MKECLDALDWLLRTRPCSDTVWPATDLGPVVDVEACRWLGDLPDGPRCGSLALPNVLMFDDAKWICRRAQAQESRFRAWLDKVRRLVVLEIGAGVHVPSVRMFVPEAQYNYDARLVRINPREPLAPNPVDVGMQTGALAGLRAIDAALAASWS